MKQKYTRHPGKKSLPATAVHSLLSDETFSRWRIILIAAFLLMGFMAFKGLLSNINKNFEPALNVDEVNKKIATAYLPFLENKGQTDENVAFYAQVPIGTIFIEKNGDITYKFVMADNMGTSFRENAVTTQSIAPKGDDAADTIVSYIKGKDESQWQKNIQNYNVVQMGEVFKKINLDLKARGNGIEKIFTVYPGGHVDDIGFNFEGINQLTISEDGTLMINTAAGKTVMSKPVAYQEIASEKRNIDASYRLIGETGYGFSVGEYDTTQPLIIDPLVGSTYLGGSASPYGGGNAYDWASAVAFGPAPDYDIYVSGFTQSSNFPTENDFGTSYDTTLTDSGNSTYTRDVFVSRFSADLTNLKASTYLGGVGWDRWVQGIAYYEGGGGVNEGIYINGTTIPEFGNNFPTPNVYGTSYDTTSTGDGQGFVAQFDPTLQTLYAATYLPWSGSIIINANGLYVGGVYRLNPDLTSLLSSTSNFGGSGSESVWGSGVDSAGNIYICGNTTSSDMPVTVGGGLNGSGDAFITKFNADLSTQLAQRYLGGSGSDYCMGIEGDSSGNIFISGMTNSTDFPTTNTYGTSVQTTIGGGMDNLVTKLDSSLNILASTYYGGTSDENFTGGFSGMLAVDSSDRVYLYSHTGTLSTTVTWGYDPVANGGNLYIARFDSTLTTLESQTYLGTGNTSALVFVDISVSPDASEDVVITSVATGTYPTTAGAYDTTYNGGNDGVVTRITNNLAALVGTIVNLAGTAGNGQVTLTWTIPTGGPNSYLVEYGTVASGTFGSTCVTAGCTDAAAGAVINGLVNGTAYQFRIRPSNPFYTGAYSNTAVATPFAVPSPPLNLVATPGNLSVDLDWDTPLDDGGFAITNYRVRYGESSGPNICDPTTSPYTNCLLLNVGVTNSTTISTLDYGVDYIFAVFAQNSQGVSSPSNTDTATPTCSFAAQFCGAQEISSSTLTFISIPESFTFGEITAGSTQDLFNNDNTGNPPTAISPGADLLQVFDDRGSGGFIVDIDTTGTFSDGINTIPLTNLYIVTSLDETDPNNGNTGLGEEAGVTYDATIGSPVRNVVAPVYVDMDSADLASRTTYTGQAPDSQFGGSPLVLMNGTLSSAFGRSGNMSQFVNFHLRVPALQAAGDYDIILTYTLSDSTT
ncbi:MAG TPA: fibronectin type III domain-containing protein [Candidatus Gracilibacteria bacterium]|nr:fibronectin type III domain-containing protein [Candidatus Gracilibacteria bacterium]